MKRTIAIFTVFSLIAVSGFSQTVLGGLSEKDILRKIDSYREYKTGGFSFNYSLKSEEAEASVMRVYINASNQEAVLAKYLAPNALKGRVILMQRQSCWLYDKGMSSPIRLSPNQMLLGEASAGDISRLVFSGSYSIQEIDETEEDCLLSLSVLPNKDMTYPKLKLKVKRNTLKPITLDCFSKTGVLLKSIEYTDFDLVDGKELLTGFEIKNELNKKKSKIVLDDFSGTTVAARFFNKDALSLLK